MSAKRKLPLSGDKLVDDIFKLLVQTLDKEIKNLYLKKDLRYPNEKREGMYGLLIEDDGIIYLDKPKYRRENPIVLSSLIHELLHRAMGRASHGLINRFERDLLEDRHGLTSAQKRYLKQYIPKHVVKHEPSLEKGAKK